MRVVHEHHDGVSRSMHTCTRLCVEVSDDISHDRVKTVELFYEVDRNVTVIRCIIGVTLVQLVQQSIPETPIQRGIRGSQQGQAVEDRG